jgi:hypothetical protein
VLYRWLIHAGRFGDLQTETAAENKKGLAKPAAAAAATAVSTDPKVLAREKRFKAAA